MSKPLIFMLLLLCVNSHKNNTLHVNGNCIETRMLLIGYGYEIVDNIKSYYEYCDFYVKVFDHDSTVWNALIYEATKISNDNYYKCKLIPYNNKYEMIDEQKDLRLATEIMSVIRLYYNTLSDDNTITYIIDNNITYVFRQRF